MYYEKGAAKKKLDFFLTFFQVRLMCHSCASILMALVLHLYEGSFTNGH